MIINNPHLARIVADLERLCPQIGQRAQAAARLLLLGHVRHEGIAPWSGEDRYRVGDYQCSILGDSCDCRDRAPYTPIYGYLCKHRLAAFFDHTLSDIARDTIGEILRLAARTHAPYLTLQVRTQYSYQGTVYKQRNELIRYRIASGLWQNTEEALFTMRDLQAALLAESWQVAENGQLIVGRHQRGQERWVLEPMDPFRRNSDGEIATAIHSLYGIDAEIAEERNRENRIMEMWEARDG